MHENYDTLHSQQNGNLIWRKQFYGLIPMNTNTTLYTPIKTKNIGNRFNTNSWKHILQTGKGKRDKRKSWKSIMEAIWKHVWNQHLNSQITNQ